MTLNVIHLLQSGLSPLLFSFHWHPHFPLSSPLLKNELHSKSMWAEVFLHTIRHTMVSLCTALLMHHSLSWAGCRGEIVKRNSWLRRVPGMSTQRPLPGKKKATAFILSGLLLAPCTQLPGISLWLDRLLTVVSLNTKPSRGKTERKMPLICSKLH